MVPPAAALLVALAVDIAVATRPFLFTVVETDSPDECFLLMLDRVTWKIPLWVDQRPTEPVPAGDTYIGYFLAARQRGLSLRDAMEQATEASAICVTRAGAAPSIPRL